VTLPPLAVPPVVADLLAVQAPVALGVSGGKDSSALALAVCEELDRRGHAGPRLLAHADLGRTEWRQSAEVCVRLAERLGVELVTVRRAAGGMMERWQQRWRDNVARYAALACVQLILPWSTASMRFCTSELKTAVIWRELKRRFPGQVVLNGVGIRAEESPKRARAEIAKPYAETRAAGDRLIGYTWLPIHGWRLADVLAIHEARRFPLHEAYTVYGTSRVSCVYCILASQADLAAAATSPENHAIYREMVDLEISSSFAFQERAWLGDTAPHLLSDDQRAGLADAKRRAATREAAEARIPRHLLYDGKGWPRLLPTPAEATLLAEVRVQVARAVGIAIDYQTPDAILARYAALMEAAGRAPAPVLVQDVLPLT
jgi:3'-phosphoadenosine 5'-phosphosulfate sulfotransferase (PAPS reductase)/FAD synthetase